MATVVPVVQAVPLQAVPAVKAVAVPAAAGGVAALAQYQEMFVSQTRRGCLQELMGCEANNEFLIAPLQDKQNTTMYALEESSFCQRLCCANLRESKMTVRMGNKETQGPIVMKYERPCQCAQVQPCKCCCYQDMKFTDANDQVIGGIKEEGFFCFVPSMSVYDAQGQSVFNVQMPTACGGVCVDCMAEGCCNCKIPFYVYPPGVHERHKELKGVGGTKNAQITKVWAGLGNELFTDADKFEVTFPDGADPTHKALLLGSVFFLNMNFFEKQNDNGGGGGDIAEMM